jgi:4'-phosphopantetheinyl transferase
MSAQAPRPLPTPEVCDVWSIDLGVAAFGQASIHLLDSAETARAARLRVDRDRQRFMICRCALREILSAYLRTAPQELRFTSGEHGKPSLPGSPIEFNVSHSGDLGLIVISASGPLGVDVEAPREVSDPLDLAIRYFHSEEREAVERASPADRHRIFLACWTRKEAVLKSIGVGLTLDPRRIRVGATSEERSIRLAWHEARHEVRIRSLEPAHGYVAACATSASVERLQCLSFGASMR